MTQLWFSAPRIDMRKRYFWLVLAIGLFFGAGITCAQNPPPNKTKKLAQEITNRLLDELASRDTDWKTIITNPHPDPAFNSRRAITKTDQFQIAVVIRTFPSVEKASDILHGEGWAASNGGDRLS